MQVYESKIYEESIGIISKIFGHKVCIEGDKVYLKDEIKSKVPIGAKMIFKTFGYTNKYVSLGSGFYLIPPESFSLWEIPLYFESIVDSIEFKDEKAFLRVSSIMMIPFTQIIIKRKLSKEEIKKVIDDFFIDSALFLTSLAGVPGRYLTKQYIYDIKELMKILLEKENFKDILPGFIHAYFMSGKDSKCETQEFNDYVSYIVEYSEEYKLVIKKLGLKV
uniref:Uncharacterized protein n=1 Tax=Pithovirus LCDPAC01 TaxID=2506600 RepID=A0A481YMJ2_9VIRU|nr:MAG: hypothetical protein LCDPAC01_00490 [Pithovirus LCDPAC01]